MCEILFSCIIMKCSDFIDWKIMNFNRKKKFNYILNEFSISVSNIHKKMS